MRPGSGAVLLSKLLFEALVLLQKLVVGLDELLHLALGLLIIIIGEDVFHGFVKIVLTVHRLLLK